MKDNWTKMGNSWVSPTRLPGVYKKKGGGFFVRARVKDSMTGKYRNIKKGLSVATEFQALEWLENKKVELRAVVGGANIQRPRFGNYAVSLLKRKAKNRELGSRASQDRWTHTLAHLIEGTESQAKDFTAPGFGELLIDEIRLAHIERWRAGVSELIERGEYSPTTANGWLSILCVIMKAATREFELPRLATEHVPKFSTVDHVVYSEEDPNSLPPDRVPEFLRLMREEHPQFYAMTYLGLVTGLRPCNLRPLRRRGETPDVVWVEGRLLVRRSQTRGQDVRKNTKQGVRYSIHLPDDAMKVLRWHVETQLATPEQKESELLFPSVSGGFRAPTVLNKPFAAVSTTMKLGFRLTQRGMRRTYNDLARAANIDGVVTRSVSGHLTEKMQEHYSTVNKKEQTEGLARVIDLMTARSSSGPREVGGPHGGPHTPAGGPHTKKPAATSAATG